MLPGAEHTFKWQFCKWSTYMCHGRYAPFGFGGNRLAIAWTAPFHRARDGRVMGKGLSGRPGEGRDHGWRMNSLAALSARGIFVRLGWELATMHQDSPPQSKPGS